MKPTHFPPPEPRSVPSARAPLSIAHLPPDMESLLGSPTDTPLEQRIKLHSVLAELESTLRQRTAAANQLSHLDNRAVWITRYLKVRADQLFNPHPVRQGGKANG